MTDRLPAPQHSADLTAGDSASLSRRSFLRGLGATASLIGGGALFAACGSGSTSSTTTLGNSSPKRGGHLRVGCTGGASSDNLDPLTANTNPDLLRGPLLYDCLVQLNENAQPTLQLAEEITPNSDATAWTVRIRDGVEFHNGKTLTADDVLYTYQQILNPKHPVDDTPLLPFLDLQSTRTLDSRTIRFGMHFPYAPFLEAITGIYASGIIPVGFDPKAPVGTGPFKYQSFTPTVQSTFGRNENYWQHGLPYLDAISIVEFADDPSQTNALESNTIDAIAFAEAADIASLKAAGFKTITTPGGWWNPFTMRVDKAPFNDVRVRQAFRLIVDRVQMRELVFDGYGSLGNDLYAVWDPDYDMQEPQREQDLNQAKFLLKQAGAENLAVTVVTSPVSNGIVEQATVFAQQAKGAGVNMTVQQVPTTTFYGPNYLHWTFSQDVWDYNPYWPQTSATTLPTSNYSETHFNNPRYTQLYNEGIKTLDTSKRREIAAEMQTIQYNEGGYIVPVIVPNLSAYASRVHGLVGCKSGLPFNNANFNTVWMS